MNFDSGRSKSARGGELGRLDKGATQRPVRKAGERGGSLIGISSRAAQRLRYGAAALDESHGTFQIAWTLIAVLERTAPEGPFLRIAAGKCDQNWQRDLAVAKIVA